MATPIGTVIPKKVSLSEITSKLLRPALTSHFYCQFNPPDSVRNYIKDNKEFNYDAQLDFISLSCCEASLPGSSLQTNEINDDYTGVTERLAYRRQYDDRADFTFYVDHGIGDYGDKFGLTKNYIGDYNSIWFFEQWIAYIANEQKANGIDDSNYNYRFRFPEVYRSPALYITKFERDFEGSMLHYRFIDAYPISINSMPVSYESSELLKCTVSFTYTRYIVDRGRMPEIPDDKLGPVGKPRNSEYYGPGLPGNDALNLRIAYIQDNIQQNTGNNPNFPLPETPQNR
jgi:hypothetical protein